MSGEECEFTWPAPGKFGHHCCVKPIGHAGSHECDCSMRTRSDAANGD